MWPLDLHVLLLEYRIAKCCFHAFFYTSRLQDMGIKKGQGSNHTVIFAIEGAAKNLSP